MTFRPKTPAVLAVFAIALLVTACGQSGPLYIPGDPSRMTVPPENPDNLQQADGADAEPDTGEQQQDQ